MRKSLKIIVIIGIVIACSVIIVAINGGNGNNSVPIFIGAGLLAAVRAVWKYKPKEEVKETNVENQELDKK